MRRRKPELENLYDVAERMRKFLDKNPECKDYFKYVIFNEGEPYGRR